MNNDVNLFKKYRHEPMFYSLVNSFERLLEEVSYTELQQAVYYAQKKKEQRFEYPNEYK